MKKLLFLVMLTSMFGTAHATRSRMNSLGQDPNLGSFYLMDNRDFFRNPANAAKMRNFMVAELGTQYVGVETENVNVDGNLEGGYFGEFSSDMAFGVYLGKRSVVLDAAVGVSPSPTYLTSAGANPLNLFLAGGSDFKWGINLNYAGTENEITGGKQKYNALGLALGIETSGGLQVYASYQTAETEGYNPSPTNAAQFVGTKIETSPFTVGIIYALNAETTIWGQYSTGDIEEGSEKEGNTAFIVGIGRIYELSPTARFNFDLSYSSAEIDPPGSSKTEKTGLPLVIGLEADAAEWLILRASVRQNFIIGEWTTTTASGETSVQSNPSLTGTKVALGGTLHFGKLKIDGNLGGFGGGSNTSLFNATNFFVNAAATYMF